MATIVLVVGNAAALTAGDTVLSGRLVANGHTVVLRSDEQAEYASAYDGVMVSDSCAGATIGAKYDTVAKPGIALEAPSWRLGTSSAQTTGVTQWSVNSVADLNGGLTGTQTVYSSGQTQQGLTVSTLGTGAQVIATQQGDATKAVYLAYEAGAALVGGAAAPARRVLFRVLDAGAVSALNSTGLALLDAAIDWAFATGAGSVTGTALASFGGLTATAAGTRETFGSALATLGGLTATTSGTRETFGSGVAVLGGLTATASGEVDTTEESGSALATLGGLTATATGVRSTAGAATAAFTFAAAALGVSGGAETGTATAAFAFAATASGTVSGVRTGTAAAAFAFAATASGTVAFAPGVEFLPHELGDSARLLVEIAWGADLAADEATWTWTDVTRDVRADPGISATMGRSDEASASQPASCSLVLDNTSGDYSLGGQSANWPNVRRNVPVRVRVNPGDGSGFRTAFVGFADGFAPGWDSLTGQIPVVDLSASGTLRRLAQGDAPVQSAYRRATVNTSSVVAYWAVEEGRDATYVPNVRGGANMTIAGSPGFEGDDSFDCSAPLPTMQDATFNADVTRYTATGENQVRFLIKVPASGLPDGTVLARITTTGTVRRWDITYELVGASDNLGVFIYDDDSGALLDSSIIGFQTDGSESRMSLEMMQNGSNVDWQIGAVSTVDSSAGLFADTVIGETVGVVSHIEIAPNGDLGETVFGHLTVQNEQTSLYEASGPLRAHLGEYPSSSTTAVSRFHRLCAENGVPLTRYTASGTDNLTAAETMGPQLVAPLLDLLRECETADQGQLWDGRAAGLSYSTRRYREDGTVALTIDAAAGELAGGFQPVDDDQRNRNRVDGKRQNGITATYSDDEGPFGTAEIGIYDSSITVNSAHDTMALQHAAWQVNLGTTGGYRFPAVTLDLRATPGLAAAALDLVPGARLDITGLEDTLTAFPTGDTVSLIVEGITHAVTASTWTATLRCSLFSPWGVGLVAAETADSDEMLGRADTDGCTLSNSYAAGVTSINVLTDTGTPIWTTVADDFPLTLDVGGIPVVATACSGTTTFQTFTVQALTHARVAGVPVKLWDPRPLALG